MNDKQLTIKGKYESVIGLEVHVELYTKSKMFCTCSADYFGKEPNTHVCPICLGLPGALPVPNKKAVEWCVKIGLALNCQIANFSKFDRKNYFYPDLPKGYQISQYDKPFCLRGEVTLSNGKKIRITRAHMEEDTAKLTHANADGENVSLIDFNRSGVPLVEIVSEPDFESTSEVVEYLKKLQQIIRYLGVSSADMEKGDMRLEPNISLRPKGSKQLPKYKVEVKNINSFKFVDKVIGFELKRQEEILEKGETPKQETRGWSEQKQVTLSQRSKEEAHDYRYFPEPDIPPVNLIEHDIKELKSKIPEMPDFKFKRFIKDFDLSDYDAEILVRDKQMADFFEDSSKVAKALGVSAKQIANILINKKPDIKKTTPQVFVKAIVVNNQPHSVAEKELIQVISRVIEDNEKMVSDFKSGNQNAIQALIGKVMKATKGRADPQKIKAILMKILA